MTWRTILTAAALSVLSGCGGPANEVPISGTITLAGEPIHSGRIYFTPDIAKGNDGPQGVALIDKGTFDTRRGGRSAPPGVVRVRVDGYGPPPPGKSDGPAIVWEYEVEMELPRRDSKIEITVPESARAKPAPKGVAAP